MAHPSSSQHDRDRGDRTERTERTHRSERERERSSHHHHRTILSTTLLLVLSLVLAVLAVMLSLPSSSPAASGTGEAAANSGLMSLLTPKRSHALIARESSVAMREADVARREAELLVGAPGGVIPQTAAPIVCPACVTATTTETVVGPIQTIIKEIVKEDSLATPGWANIRAEEILDRELKIAEREREISKREESVNRREHDASRRESWIMEQLVALGNDEPQRVEEEYVYEPVGSKRKAKQFHELPPLVVSEVSYETETQTVTKTQLVTVPPPAQTRLAAFPSPVVSPSHSTTDSPRTTAVEIVVEREEEPEPLRRSVSRGAPPIRKPPAKWFGGGW
jgi:hypothetical protein